MLVFQFFSRYQQRAPGELTPAVYASQDIEADTRITAEMLEIREVPALAVPAAHFNFLEEVIGKNALYPVLEGEVILDSKLAGELGGAAAQRCPAGKWCVSVPVDWFVAAPPNLAVGDQVEIASVQAGRNFEEAGFIASGIGVVELPNASEGSAYVLAVEDQEALSLLFARANEFTLLILLRPAGR